MTALACWVGLFLVFIALLRIGDKIGLIVTELRELNEKVRGNRE